MRKLLLTVMMAAMALAEAGAQQQSPFVKSDTPMKSAAAAGKSAAPKRALGTNQKYMGPYETDDVAEYGMAFNSAGDRMMGAMLPASYVKKYDGGKIVAMRFALCDTASVSRVFAISVDDGVIGSDAVSQEVSSASAGWNEVQLATPYTISADGTNTFLIGYEYTQTSGSYPISMAGEAYDGGFYSCPSGGSWTNYGVTSYGNVSVQAIVEKDGIQSVVDVSVDGIQFPAYVKKGGTATVKFTAHNFSSSSASCDFDITVDGSTVATITSCAVDNTQKTCTADIAIGSGYEAGRSYTLAVSLKSVDGGAPAGDTSDDELSASFIPYSETAERQMNLVEQLTATWCMYCPYGAAGIEELTNQRDDVAWVSLHSSDSYSVSESSSLMSFIASGSIPAAAVNRYLFDGEDAIAFTIGYSDASYLANMLSGMIDETAEACPTFAKLDIETTYDSATRGLAITVKGTGVENAAQLMSDDILTVYLTEEGVTSKQNKLGTYVSGYLHHGLLRKVVSGSTGDALTWSGDNFEKTYSVTLDSGWDAEQMHVVAATSRPFYDTKAGAYKTDLSDAWVSNTNRVAVGSSTSGMENAVKDSSGKSVTAYYTTSGTRLNAPQKGVNIIRFSDGTARKVVVR